MKPGYWLLLSLCFMLSGCGQDINARLVQAAKQGQTDEVRALLEQGADPNARDATYHATAVMWAAHEGHDDALKALLDRGGAIDAHNDKGETALWYAAQKGRPGAARILLERGADPMPVARGGVSAAQVARSEGHPDVADLLERAQASDKRGHQETSPDVSPSTRKK